MSKEYEDDIEEQNVHIPWDRSKLVGDNNNFVKFKDWTRLRENRN